MNRPGPTTYLIGNPLSAVLIVLTALLVCFRWWTANGDIHWIAPAVAVAFASSAAKSSQALRSYYVWAGNYAVMGGETPPTLMRDLGHVLRKLMAGLMCGTFAAACGAILQPETQEDYARAGGIAIAAFVVMFGLVKLLGRTAQSLRNRSAKPKKEKASPVVSVALGVPSRSADIDKIPGKLPDYCLAVMFPPKVTSASQAGLPAASDSSHPHGSTVVNFRPVLAGGGSKPRTQR
jgi:hypothetical protein